MGKGSHRKTYMHRCQTCGGYFRSGSPISRYCSAECACGGAVLDNATRDYIAIRGRAPRKCHDCGAPCVDYRCGACQEKWRRKHGVNVVWQDAALEGLED